MGHERIAVMVVGLVVATGLFGCGRAGPGPGAAPDVGEQGASVQPEQTSSDGDAATGTSDDPTVEVGAGAVGRLTDADLPNGWEEVPWQERLGDDPGVPAYCGVTVEPADLRVSQVWFYEMRSLPSNVIEYVMVGTEESATALMDELVEHRDTCEEPGRVVEPVDLSIGEQSVAWDFVSDTSFRVLVFRRGASVVTLGATGVTSLPVDEHEQIARAIDAALTE